MHVAYRSLINIYNALRFKQLPNIFSFKNDITKTACTAKQYICTF
jgi:hypothetical protein